MSNKDESIYGAIEAGGTKFICALGKGGDEILDRVVIKTRGPVETVKDVISYFDQRSSLFPSIKTVGLGSFGPIDIDDKSPTFGYLNETPKAGWSGMNLLGVLSDSIPQPIALDTDVNCALIAEAAYGAGRGLSDLIYLTIGTGIGGGLMTEGRILYGTSHTEIGHILVPKEKDDADFAGVCNFHGDRCIESLASGPSIYARWGEKADDLSPHHAAWDLEARYLAALCHNLLMSTAPQKIIMGGGVMTQKHLFSMIRQKLELQLNGYGAFPVTSTELESIIVPPDLNGDAGIIGAIEIAKDYIDGSKKH